MKTICKIDWWRRMLKHFFDFFDWPILYQLKIQQNLAVSLWHQEFLSNNSLKNVKDTSPFQQMYTYEFKCYGRHLKKDVKKDIEILFQTFS